MNSWDQKGEFLDNMYTSLLMLFSISALDAEIVIWIGLRSSSIYPNLTLYEVDRSVGRLDGTFGG
jgi:hypothetical protein